MFGFQKDLFNMCPHKIEPERQALGLVLCYACAEAQVTPYKGDMNYQHKTAPDLMLMSASEHANYRRYVPYGKYTGRGSGTHKMSRPVVKLG